MSGAGAWRMGLLGLAACAAAAPVTGFDSSAGAVLVEIAADGFVTSDGRRMPLEALVLRLRQRTRSMTEDERSRFVVHLRIAAALARDDGAAGQRAKADMNRLVDQLFIMGVRQVSTQ